MYFLCDISTFTQSVSTGIKPRKPRQRRGKRLLGDAKTVAGSALGTASTASVLGLLRPATPKLAIGAALTGAAVGTAQGIGKIRRKRKLSSLPRKPKTY